MADRKETISRTAARRIDGWEAAYRRGGDRYGLAPSRSARETLVYTTRGTSLLELGCGYGRDLRFFCDRHPTLRAIGVDASSRAAARARGLLPDVQVICGDVLAKATWDDVGPADLVFGNFFWHLFLDSERHKILDRTARVLGPAGRLVASLVSTEDQAFGRGEEIEPNTFMVYSDRFWHFFDRAEIEAFLPRFGLEIERLDHMRESESIDGVPSEVEFWYVVACTMR